jgi:hypothetical protein
LRSSTVEARLSKRSRISNPLLRTRLRSYHLARFCTIWDIMGSLTSHSIWLIKGWRVSRPVASAFPVLHFKIIKITWIYNSVLTANMLRVREHLSRWKPAAVVMALEEAKSSSISKPRGSTVKKFPISTIS